MTVQVILEGDIARTVEIRELAVAPIASIVPHLERQVPTIMPVMPKGTVSATFDGNTNRGSFLIERPPRRTELTIYGDYNDEDEDEHGDERTYRLALPFQYFLFFYNLRPEYGDRPFSLGDVRYLWAKQAITGPDSQLIHGRIPNVDGGGYICWGSTYTDESSLVGNINERVNSFYQTLFNGDLEYRKPMKYGWYDDWEADSIENPLCWQDWDDWRDSQPLTYWLNDIDAHNPDTAVVDGSRGSLWTPQPPIFTQARMVEHLQTLTPAQRRMTRRALDLVETP